MPASGWDGPLAIDLQAAVQAWMPDLAVAAEGFTPERTGLLRRSNRWFVRRQGREVEMRNKQPYAAAQYYGAQFKAGVTWLVQRADFMGPIVAKRRKAWTLPGHHWAEKGLDEAFPKLAEKIGWVPKGGARV